MDIKQRPSPSKKAATSPAGAWPKAALWPAIGLRLHLAVIIGLGLVMLLAFANTLHNTGFALDNKFIILEDPRLRDTKWDNVQQVFREDYWYPKAVSGLYRPLTTLSYLFNYSVLGNHNNAAGYHWINFLLHWLNAVLVYFMALVLMEKLWPAILTGAIFAMHPIVTESVTNMIGRADLFATAAVLGAFLCYVKSTTRERWTQAWWLTLAGAITLLGVFCKESAIVGVAVAIGLYEAASGAQRATPHRLANWCVCVLPVLASVSLLIMIARSSQLDLKHVLLILAPLLAYLVIIFHKARAWLANLVQNSWLGFVAWLPAFVTMFFVRGIVFARLRPPEQPFVDNPLIGFDFWTARMTAIKVIGKYFWLLLWPQTLSCDYSYNQVPIVNWSFRTWEDWKALVALAAIMIVLAVAIRNYRRNKAVFFFVLFFFGTLLPSSNLMPNPTFGQSLFERTTWCIGSIMAERFLYLPSIGYAGCLVIAVYALCRRLLPQLDVAADQPRVWLQAVSRGALLMIIAACGLRTWFRNQDWVNDVQLWSQAVQACPNSFKTHKSLAYALYEQLNPADKNYDLILDRIIEEGEQALRVTDKTQIVFLHLGAYYRMKGDRLAQTAPVGSPVSPESALWYRKSAETLEGAVPLDRAFNDDNRQKELKRGRKPDDILDIGNHEIYWNLGMSYMRLGRYQDALNAYRYMRHLVPTNPEAYLSLASVFIQAGRTEDAAILLLQTLLLDSNRQEALPALAEIYRQIDKDGCSVLFAPGQSQPMLNRDCPLVHKHICAAYAGLVQVFVETRQWKNARDTKNSALSAYSCAREVFDQLLPEPKAVKATTPKL